STFTVVSADGHRVSSVDIDGDKPVPAGTVDAPAVVAAAHTGAGLRGQGRWALFDRKGRSVYVSKTYEVGIKWPTLLGNDLVVVPTDQGARHSLFIYNLELVKPGAPAGAPAANQGPSPTP